jgi:hypothetical protein
MQGLWDANCEEIPESNDESVEDVEEEDATSSPPEDDAPIDAGDPSSSTLSRKGKIRQPLPSSSSKEEEECNTPS